MMCVLLLENAKCIRFNNSPRPNTPLFCALYREPRLKYGSAIKHGLGDQKDYPIARACLLADDTALQRVVTLLIATITLLCHSQRCLLLP